MNKLLKLAEIKNLLDLDNTKELTLNTESRLKFEKEYVTILREYNEEENKKIHYTEEPILV